MSIKQNKNNTTYFQIRKKKYNLEIEGDTRYEIIAQIRIRKKAQD